MKPNLSQTLQKLVMIFTLKYEDLLLPVSRKYLADFIFFYFTWCFCSGIHPKPLHLTNWLTTHRLFDHQVVRSQSTDQYLHHRSKFYFETMTFSILNIRLKKSFQQRPYHSFQNLKASIFHDMFCTAAMDTKPAKNPYESTLVLSS